MDRGREGLPKLILYEVVEVCAFDPDHRTGQVLLGDGVLLHVMTILRKTSDFVYFLPFLFSLYHHSEPSGTFYSDCHDSYSRPFQYDVE